MLAALDEEADEDDEGEPSFLARWNDLEAIKHGKRAVNRIGGDVPQGAVVQVHERQADRMPDAVLDKLEHGPGAYRTALTASPAVRAAEAVGCRVLRGTPPPPRSRATGARPRSRSPELAPGGSTSRPGPHPLSQ
jgi:hypothetical protein